MTKNLRKNFNYVSCRPSTLRNYCIVNKINKIDLETFTGYSCDCKDKMKIYNKLEGRKRHNHNANSLN